MNNKSLYQYIKNNINVEDGRFNQVGLPDDPNPTLPHLLGAEDAFWFAADAPAFVQRAENILKLTQEYMYAADAQKGEALYSALCEQPVITISEPFCDKMQEIQGERISNELLEWACSTFYNAEDREPLKFAYMLFGLYGVEKIKVERPELWADMAIVARCEEFTHFFLLSCELTDYKAHEEIWDIIKCTSGWGKVFAIESAECQNEEQELWLIRHGMETDVDYPPLAAHILEKSRLEKHLEQQELDRQTFKGAAIVVNSLIYFLNHYERNVLEESINTNHFKATQLLQNFLQQAKKYPDKPEFILHVLHLNHGLRQLLSNDTLCVISANDLHELIAEGDALIYARDWQKYVENNLIENDVLNYELCEFACEMDMDIWKQLFDYLCEHPLEHRILAYLFSYNDETYQQMTIHFVEHNLARYSRDESALIVPLRYLAHRPGKGEKIVIAGLTSLYDLPRSLACAVLEAWGQEYFTEALRSALLEARRLSSNDIVSTRIESLLVE